MSDYLKRHKIYECFSEGKKTIEMIKIAVCDDEKSQLEYLSNVIKKWSDIMNKPCTLSLFESAEEFWFNYGKNRFDIAVLDIQMSGQNGMELAKELRKLNDKICIIFVTGISDFIGEGYNVYAVNYLLKPIDENRLFDALTAASERNINSDNKKIVLETDGETLAVYEDEIEYLGAFSHSTSVFTESGALEVQSGMNSVMGKLSANKFVKCHRSYVINLKCVKLIKKYEILLDSGKTVPISRRMYNDVNDAFISYYKGKI